MKILPDNSRACFPLLVILWAVFASAQTKLLSDVRVSSEAIRLSDLLPQNVSANLRGITESIDLGRAPQLGTMRVLRHDQIAEILKAHPEIASRLSIPNQIVLIRAGYPLALSDIRHAVAGFQNETAGLADFPDSAFDWPRDIATSMVHPALEVRSAHWDAAQRLYLLLRCAHARDCNEFLVSFRPPESLISKYQLKPASNSKHESTATSSAPILVSSGHKARLVLQSDGMQISLQVICLENGREGETIRVRESGSFRVFRAQVLSRDLLWSRFES